MDLLEPTSRIPADVSFKIIERPNNNEGEGEEKVKGEVHNLYFEPYKSIVEFEFGDCLTGQVVHTCPLVVFIVSVLIHSMVILVMLH